jgi:PPM family protein phosphatase
VSASRNADVVVNISARTDVGMCRRGNEDCFMVADLTTGHTGLVPEVSTHRLGQNGSLLVVSDGMGGAVAGEIASDLSVKSVKDYLLNTTAPTNVSGRLQTAVESANRAVWQCAQQNQNLQGMGATLTAVLCHEGTAYIAQVGDSRAYLVRAGRIKQLTKDQSLVQLLIDAQAIRPEQANQVPNNVILQALGTRPDVIVAMTSVELCRDDYIALCSDGLSNKVTAEELRDVIVRGGNDLTGSCRQLIELANARGGEDNITILVARFDGSSLESAAERSSITGSMQALTGDDLLRIGSAQLDALAYDPAADSPQPPPDVHAVLEDLNVTLIPTQPQPTAGSVTQVAIPALPPGYSSHPSPQPEAPRPQAHAPAARPGGANKIIFATAIVLIAFALVAGVAIALYWFVILPRLMAQ